jgi:hypothetical protein
LGKGLAFWKNGCTAPPFFETFPYTWSLEISFFFKKKNPKIIRHLDLCIYRWDFSFMRK